MKWPRSYFHEPPDWLWWIVVRWRWFGGVLYRLTSAMPGTCHASVVGFIANPADGCKPESLSAAGCLRDAACAGSCWCGKYQSLDELESALASPFHIRDPWYGLVFEFVDAEGEDNT